MPAAATKEIDARGSFCPGPLMELIRAIRDADVGDTIAILSKDPGSRTDIPAWVAKAQHEMVEITDEDGFSRYVVKKAR